MVRLSSSGRKLLDLLCNQFLSSPPRFHTLNWEWTDLSLSVNGKNFKGSLHWSPRFWILQQTQISGGSWLLGDELSLNSVRLVTRHGFSFIFKAKLLWGSEVTGAGLQTNLCCLGFFFLSAWLSATRQFKEAAQTEHSTRTLPFFYWSFPMVLHFKAHVVFKPRRLMC